MKKSLTKFLVVSSVVLGGVLVAHENVNAIFGSLTGSIACSQVSCKTKMGLGKCVKTSRYGGSTDYASLEGQDPKCAGSANTLCKSNGCDLSSIGFDCTGAPNCPAAEEEPTDDQPAE